MSAVGKTPGGGVAPAPNLDTPRRISANNSSIQHIKAGIIISSQTNYSFSANLTSNDAITARASVFYTVTLPPPLPNTQIEDTSSCRTVLTTDKHPLGYIA